MDQINHPSQNIWEQRQEWFEILFDDDKRPGSYMVGEQATGLLVDLQAIYCAGAFISCIIISCTIIDSHIRETETGPNFEGSIKEAFEFSDYCDELEWLRKTRNRLIHFKETKDLPVSVDDQWFRREEHEKDAKKSIELVANVLFENPWI